ncbi:MAG: metal-dependent hydrolase, partial [Pseudomonadota bacterium]
MDSLTQAVLGAAVGAAVLGRRAGRKAPLWGAVLGTLPDLDVLVPFGSPVADFTYHRGHSHALFWLTLAAPAFAWLITRLHRDQRAEFRGWWLLCCTCLVTHTLLDALTIYGTQLGLPFTDHPFGTGSVFVIDPAYTLPLLL